MKNYPLKHNHQLENLIYKHQHKASYDPLHYNNETSVIQQPQSFTFSNIETKRDMTACLRQERTFNTIIGLNQQKLA